MWAIESTSERTADEAEDGENMEVKEEKRDLKVLRNLVDMKMLRKRKANREGSYTKSRKHPVGGRTHSLTVYLSTSPRGNQHTSRKKSSKFFGRLMNAVRRRKKIGTVDPEGRYQSWGDLCSAPLCATIGTLSLEGSYSQPGEQVWKGSTKTIAYKEPSNKI